MSKWIHKLIPHSKEVARAKELSQKENDRADVEQASAVANALTSAATAAQVGQINYNNGFSVALGSAFAKRGTV